jgi:hypothetical protein
MTNIELQAANAQISMNREVVNHLTSIDWEQRRYEIAKDVLCGMIAAGKSGDVRDAVQVADALITVLKDK